MTGEFRMSLTTLLRIFMCDIWNSLTAEWPFRACDLRRWTEPFSLVIALLPSREKRQKVFSRSFVHQFPSARTAHWQLHETV